MVYLIAYFSTLVVFVVCDMAWLGTMASRLYRLITAKVTLAIHWEALRLWLKGMRLRNRPSPSAHDHAGMLRKID